MQEVMIVDAVRIPRALSGGKAPVYGALKPLDLLKPLFQALTERNQFDSQQVEDVLLGCATPHGGQGANIAKIASLYAGWSEQVSGVTLNRFCCSGLDAINLGASKIMAGMESLIVAGGIEQLSAVPMFSDQGAWYSDPEVMRATRFVQLGVAADIIASQQGYSRQQLDQLSLASHARAATATAQGYFSGSLIPLSDDQGELLLAADNAIRRTSTASQLAAMPTLFNPLIDSTRSLVAEVYPQLSLSACHSIGNSPALVDGASLVLLASAERCRALGLTPRARLRHFANASDEPVKMLTGHIRATEKMFKATGLQPEQVDLWEVNESFAASVLNFQHSFAINDQRLNVNGSAIAMGHPLGATGGNLLGMLIDELERRDLQRGVVAICGGAGVGVASLIERV